MVARWESAGRRNWKKSARAALVLATVLVVVGIASNWRSDQATTEKQSRVATALAGADETPQAGGSSVHAAVSPDQAANCPAPTDYPFTACIRSKDYPRMGNGRSSYGSVNVPKTGYVTGVVVTYANGSMNIGNGYVNGHWGSVNWGWGGLMYLWVTDGRNNVLFPNTVMTSPTGVRFSGPHGHWAANGQVTTSPSVTMSGTRGFFVNQGDEVRLWHGEHLFNVHYADNHDVTVCVDVKFTYGSPPPAAEACIRSKDYPRTPTARFSYGSIRAQQAGYVVGVKVTRVSGNMNIGNGYANGFWGSTNAGWGKRMYLFVTDGEDNLMFPNTRMPGVTYNGNGWWVDNSHTTTTATVVLQETAKGFHVKAGDEIRLWHGEQLFNVHYPDNHDVTVCATVELIYGSAPPPLETCIGSKDFPRAFTGRFSYGSVQAPQSGYVSGIKVTRVSGDMNIGPGYANGYWGSTNAGWARRMYLWVTNAQNRIIFPNTQIGSLTSFHGNGWWTAGPSVTTTSPSVTLDGTKGFLVNAGDEIRLWHGEQILNAWYTDNADKSVCVKVELIYATTPQACIRSKDYPRIALSRSSYGSVRANKTGYIVGVKVTHPSGSLNIGNGYANGFWGSTNAGWGKRMYLWVSDAQNKAMFPNTGMGNQVSAHRDGWWHPGVAMSPQPSTTSASVTLKGTKGFFVRGGDEIRLWHGEQLLNAWYTDNHDVMVCVQVELIYGTTLSGTHSVCNAFKNETDCNGCGCAWDGAIQSCRCKAAPSDFVFLVDGSGSVSSASFAVQSEIVVDMITHMVPIGAGVGVVQFSNQLQTEVALFPRQTASAVLQGVNAMTQLGGGTNIGDAMTEALSATFLGSSSARSTRWVVLLTDGANNGGVDPCSPSITSAIAADPNLRVLIIGVSAGFDAAGVACLVQNEVNPASHIITMPNYSLAEFQKIAPNVNRQICPAQPV